MCVCVCLGLCVCCFIVFCFCLCVCVTSWYGRRSSFLKWRSGVRGGRSSHNVTQTSTELKGAASSRSSWLAHRVQTCPGILEPQRIREACFSLFLTLLSIVTSFERLQWPAHMLNGADDAGWVSDPCILFSDRRILRQNKPQQSRGVFHRCVWFRVAALVRLPVSLLDNAGQLPGFCRAACIFMLGSGSPGC